MCIDPTVSIPLTKQPTLAIAAAATFLGLRIVWTGADTVSSFGDARGDEQVLAALAALAPPGKPELPFTAATFGPKTAYVEVTAIHAQLNELLGNGSKWFSATDQYGYNDMVVWGSIRSNSASAGLMRKAAGQAEQPHLFDWFTRMEALPAVCTLAAAIAKARSAADKGRTAKRADNIEAKLPNAVQGQVVLRFAPEPSGYLHIGHLKAAILNRFFADMYGGTFLLRFDDTNPLKEEGAFEEAIKEDLAMIEVAFDRVVHTSDHFDAIRARAEQLIMQGDAYMDDTDPQVVKDQRRAVIPSKHRDASIDTNMQRFRDLCAGEPGSRAWFLRAKIDYTHKNGTMRDPVIFRFVDGAHHITGTKYTAYPTYDLACPVIDHIDGVTHALRANEYAQHHEQYAWFLQKLGLRNIEIFDFSRIDFVYTVLSKRKLKYLVDNGVVSGWGDPRFPTVRGIRARGMTVKGIKDYIASQGASQKTLQLEWDSIWTVNKRVIDPIAPRYWAIAENKMVPIFVEGRDTDAETVETRPLHKKNPAVGDKQLVFSSKLLVEQEDAKSFTLGEEITLMDWGNAIVTARAVDDEDKNVTSLALKLNPGGDYKTTSKKVTWLSAPTEAHKLVPVVLIEYDYLITKKKLEEDDDLAAVVNPKTEYRTPALASAEVGRLNMWDIIQFERKGFYIYQGTKDADGRMEFGYIPDGRAESVALKATPAPESRASGVKSGKGGSWGKMNAAAKRNGDRGK